MKLLITGAAGFLGKYVVQAALSQGHTVRALIRPASPPPHDELSDNISLEFVRHDLRSKTGIDDLLTDIDCVIHLAASKAGDLYEQFGGTVSTTENLLESMVANEVGRIVLIGSFSVYEYLRKREWSLLDENSPLVLDPYDRDDYCQTKLVQERLVLEYAKLHSWKCVVLRPGVIFGPYNLWTARLGMQISDSLWIRTGAFARLPLTYVENCADAVIAAASPDNYSEPQVLNVVDDNSPTQRQYLRKLQENLSPRPRIIPIPWTVIRLTARLAWLVNKVCFKGTAKIPGLFIPSRLHARCKPLRYTNQRITEVLGWRPKISWEEGIVRSINIEKQDAQSLNTNDQVKQ